MGREGSPLCPGRARRILPPSGEGNLVTTTFPPVDNSFPTLVLPLRPLVELLTQCQQTCTPFDCASGELKEVDLALGVLLENFKQSTAGQDFSEEDDLVVEDALEAFDGLRGMMASLYISVSENDVEATIRDVQAMVGQVRVLEECQARLLQSEAARPVLSPVPAINSILRAGKAIQEGRKNWSLLVACLEALQPAWNALISGPEIPLEVEAHGHALEELVRVVNGEDLEALAPALEAVRVTGEALMGLKARLDAPPPPPPEPASFLCPRCGEAVGEWDRTCPSCNARMPERVPEGSVGKPLGVTENLPDYLQTLFNQAEMVRAGNGDWEAFQAAIAELRRRSEQSLAVLERVPAPPANVPADEMEAWSASQESVENGMEKFFEGLQRLESLTPELDEQVLDRALEDLLAAVRETRQVAVFIQRLVEGRLAARAAQE